MAKKRFPETSRAAYESLDPEILGDRWRKILWALGQMPNGGTSEEIAKALKVKDGVIWRRLSELKKWGFITQNGLKRPLKSGREGFVWIASKEPPMTERVLPGKTVVQFSKALIQPTASKYTEQQLF